MKVLKIVLLSILSIFAVIYLAFLFVLPNAIDLNQYSPQITKAIQESTGFKVNISGLKVKTAWNLSAGAQIDKTDLSYPTGKKFAQVNDLQIRLSLLPMVLGKIKVDKIDINKVMLNLDVKKDGKFLIEDYLPKNKAVEQKPAFEFSPNMPAVFAKSYRVSFVDVQTSKTYTIKGSDLKVSDFILNKKIKVKTKGELVLNNRKQMSYNIALYSKVFSQGTNQKSENINIIKDFEDLYKYNLQTTINANLKMTGSPDDTKIDGKVNLDKISFVFGGEKFPPSNLALDFSGNKIKINSNLYTDVNSKATITGEFKNGKHKAINLRVISDKIDLDNAVSIANTILKTFGKKDLEGISASGHLKANFDIKSDFKKIQSSGYLKVENASLTNKLYNVVINAINADIDFSQDSINIRQAKANLDSHPIILKGTIDKNANADILVLANNLQLKGLLLSTGNTQLLKENDIKGLVSLRAEIKGRLDKASPKVNVIASNIYVKNRPSKTQIKLSKAVINVIAGKKTKGAVQLVNLKASPNASSIISSPRINLSFDDKNLKIEKSYLYLNGIRTNLDGKISDINSTPRLNSINISVPNQISMPIDGFAGSSIILKGNITLSGNPSNPKIEGGFIIPLIRIPSIALSIKNTELSLDKEFSINCPQIHIANSTMSFSSQINKDFSKGIVLKNSNFASNNIDLDSLGSALSNMPQGSNSNIGITISNGKTNIGRFKTGNIIARNITSGLSLKNNFLYLNNLDADAYLGEIKGNINYNLLNGKTGIDIRGRGLSANSALIALTNRNDKIVGVLDFDSDISVKGATQNEILNNLSGSTDFIIHNGQMGVLGKFEHLLYAQNILSNNVFKGTLNIIAKALTIKNTGVYKYMKGKITFSNGWANIAWVKTSGPSMSLYMSGRYYLPGNTADLTILGRISDDIVRILGPIGEFSMDKAISSIPKIGEITAYFVSQFTVNPNYENTDLIPDLSPKTEFGTKEFKVVIDGDIQKQSSVKTFKWISKPTVAQAQARAQMQNPTETIKQYQTTIKEEYNGVVKKLPTSVPDFVNKLPDLLN